MGMFTVIATREPEKIGAKINETCGDGTYYALGPNAWLVDFDGTTRDLAEALGIRAGDTGAGVVLSVENYSGRASPDIWEWMKVHFAGDHRRSA
jgi:hypothetical protein